MWQKCPICNGTGKIEEPNLNSCPICKGQRIISESTGLPPIVNQATTVKQYPTSPLERYLYIKERFDTKGRAFITEYEFNYLTEFEKNK